MRKFLMLTLAGCALLLTACNQTVQNSAPESIAEPITELSAEETVPETLPVTEEITIPETETVPEVIPTEPSNPADIIGIWKGETGYRWFQENGGYVTMTYQGAFPDDIPIEVNETSIVLTIDGNPLTLTQTGTHVFDTIDGLYNAEGQEYQIFITGNLVYRYYSHDDANAYQYDGQNLMLPWSENAMNCFVSGDTLEIEGQIFTRTHELDDFLLS
ncbi:MAG: hypothetical protein IJ644_07335 [Oscillospiraceae bacterium]|nr:hypothetical protein [Oscillospiraceae bacterium]